MSFNAHDLKVAFEDGRKSERIRILRILRNKIITDDNNGDQHNDYKYYERLFEDQSWDIGEL